MLGLEKLRRRPGRVDGGEAEERPKLEVMRPQLFPILFQRGFHPRQHGHSVPDQIGIITPAQQVSTEFFECQHIGNDDQQEQSAADRVPCGIGESRRGEGNHQGHKQGKDRRLIKREIGTGHSGFQNVFRPDRRDPCRDAGKQKRVLNEFDDERLEAEGGH